MRFYGSLVLATILILESTSLAESVASVRSKLVNATVYREPDSGPLCGVHATCIALRLIGVSAFEGDFLTTKYISSCQGSRAEDICAMVEDAGGRASQLGRLSAFDIRTFSGPIVANVRRNPSDDRFNHWVVVLVQRDGVVVYDGLDEPRQMSMGEFLGVWSGIGILVSNANVCGVFYSATFRPKQGNSNRLRLLWLCSFSYLHKNSSVVDHAAKCLYCRRGSVKSSFYKSSLTC